MLATVIFIVIALVAVAAALGMLLSNNAVHSALLLVLNFTCVALFYLGLGAPFLAMVQIAVYAGAIMVLFLFVIMLLGAERVTLRSTLRWQGPAAVVLAVALVGMAIFATLSPQLGATLTLPPTVELAGGSQVFGSPQAVAPVLLIDYVLPFQVVGVLLLVAMVGAVVLAKDERPVHQKPDQRPEHSGD